MTIIVDSSVVVKWFVDEDHSAEALNLRSGSLAAPELLMVECVNVFWKKTRKSEMDEARVRPAIEALTLFGLDLWPAARLADRAFEIARTLDHAVYDCFYLALAERLAAPLVTADTRLINKLAAARGPTDIRLVSLEQAVSLTR